MSLQGLRHCAITRRWFAVAVVLAMSLKALVPAGFMLAPADGHPRLVLCPAGIHLAHGMPAGMSMSMDHSHAMAMQHGPDAAHATHAAMSADHCLFAQAAGSALQVKAAHVTSTYFSILRPAAVVTLVALPPDPPIRHLAPRGPPSLA